MTQQELETFTRRLGEIIGSHLPGGVGFALSLFDLGADGSFAYVSNGNREDLIEAFKETIAHLEKTAPSS